MSINFPNSPAVNDIFTAGVIKYKWDGTKWYSITEGYLPLTGGTLTGVQPTLVSGTSLKSVNSTSLLGSGDLTLFGGGLVKVEVVATLSGTSDANTLYIVTT